MKTSKTAVKHPFLKGMSLDGGSLYASRVLREAVLLSRTRFLSGATHKNLAQRQRLFRLYCLSTGMSARTAKRHATYMFKHL